MTCPFCKEVIDVNGLEKDKVMFADEFNTYLHKDCLVEALKKNPDDEKAKLVAHLLDDFDMSGTSAKFFEVYDRDTHYSVLAVVLEGDSDKDQWILNRAGLGLGSPYLIQLTELESGETHRDKYKWDVHGRTLQEVHKYLEQKYSQLPSGAVIDVEYILGESLSPRLSEFVYER